MPSPTRGSQRRLERDGQYLKSHRRVVWNFEWQDPVGVLDVYGDANWAACRRTRKSTSGGCVLRGKHCFKTWANTQALVAKSSAESEFYALVRASCEAHGAQTMMSELGEEVKVRVHVDATAAKAIAERSGLDKLRHIDVNILWIQEQEARDRIPLVKVCGKTNPADLMTKYVDGELIRSHLNSMFIEFREGISQLAAQLYELVPGEGRRSAGATSGGLGVGEGRKTGGEREEEGGGAEAGGEERGEGEGGGRCFFWARRQVVMPW